MKGTDGCSTEGLVKKPRQPKLPPPRTQIASNVTQIVNQLISLENLLFKLLDLNSHDHDVLVV